MFSPLRHIGATINGIPVITVEVTQTRDHSADQFHGEIAFNVLPANAGLSYWLDQDEIEVEVVVNDGGPGVLFTGTVDSIDADFAAQVLRIGGRDKTKGPINTKTNRDWRNKTADKIVGELAAKHGLTPKLTGADIAGKIYNMDWVKLADSVSDWSIIQHLADREGKVAWVHKNELHFAEIDTIEGGVFVVTYVPPTPFSHAEGLFERLTARHNLQLAKETEVNVHSHHTKSNKSVKATAVLKGGSSNRNVYHYRHANLHKQKADAIAKKRLREHTRHEWTIGWDGPGDSSVNPTMGLQIVGTGTSVDQVYPITQVTHTVVGGDGGYRMAISANNTDAKRGGGD